MNPAGQPLLGSKEWNRLVHGTPPLYREVAPRLDSADISALIAHLASASAEEQVAAIRLLHMATVDNIPISDSQKQELIENLLPLTHGYPSPVGQAAFHCMCTLALPLAERFLLEEFDEAKVSDRFFPFHLADLNKVESTRARDRITAFSRQPGIRGETATRFLKDLGIIDPDPMEIQALAAKWRESKSLKYLGDLCSFYIEHRIGKPIKPLLELLGPWNRHFFNEYWYDTAEGVDLFLQQDENGNLNSYKVK